MIKQLLLSVLVLLFAFTANAQFKKGSVLLGGDVSFGTNENKGMQSSSKNTNFSFSPTLGFANKENLFQGVQLTFSTVKNNFGNASENKSTTYGGNYFIRKYKPIFGKLSGFIQASAGVSFGKSEAKNSITTTTNTFSAGLGISPGINIAVTKKLYLEAGFSNIANLSYQKAKSEVANNSPLNTTSSSFGFSSNLSAAGSGLYFGFRIMLPK